MKHALGVVWLVGIVLLWPSIALSEAINVQFGPRYTDEGGEVFAEMYGLHSGPSSDSGKVWNSFLGTGLTENAYDGAMASNASLIDSRGNSTSTTLTFASYIGNALAYSALPVFRSAVYNNSGNSIDFVLSGLSAGQTYDLYAISGGDSSVFGAGTFHVTGSVISASKSSTNAGPFDSFNAGNAVLFSGVAPTVDGNLTLSLEGGSYRTLNGFQLVSSGGAPSSVPEIDPATFGSAFALLIGSLSLVEQRRRRGLKAGLAG